MLFVVKSDLSTASDRLVSFVWEKQGCVTYIFDIEKELKKQSVTPFPRSHCKFQGSAQIGSENLGQNCAWLKINK